MARPNVKAEIHPKTTAARQNPTILARLCPLNEMLIIQAARTMVTAASAVQMSGPGTPVTTATTCSSLGRPSIVGTATNKIRDAASSAAAIG